jgi:NADH dehydrogenase
VTRPQVVVIGCGFGGLEAVRALAKLPVEVTLVDRTNHHLFQPLLYQVATAGLSAPAISAPIRHTLRREIRAGHLTVLQAEVTGIDAVARTVALDGGAQALPFDHLIVAAGATHSYFGHDDWAVHAPGLKTLADAFELRSRVIGAFERAERCDDAAEREAWLTFAVIGAGPTGVEMAGTMAEIAHHTLADEFRHIDTRRSRVALIEGSDRVLGAFVPALSQRAREQLEKLGVEVRTGCRVTGIDAGGVTMQHGTPPADEHLAARTVVWAAGVAASPLGKVLAATTGCTLDRAGRVVVEPDLSLPGHACIQVIGDLAAAKSHDGRGEPKPVPGVSPGAKQMGRSAAANLGRRLRGEATRPFRYLDYGNLATIGRKAAVVDLAVPLFGSLRFSGFGAWLFWLFAHVYFLIGFRNRMMVMLDWGWAYWTYDRNARVVPQPNTPAPPKAPS